MAELKSRIRIKRGTEDKISNSNDTLPKGSLLYNETKNTLIVSDGNTEIKNLKSLTSEKVSNDGILGDGISSDIFIWLDDQYIFNNSFIDSDARFTSNGVNYNKLEITKDQDIKYYVNNAATTVYNASTNTWVNDNYKRIELQAIGSFDNYKSRVYKGNREVSQIFEEESNKVKNASLADNAINSLDIENIKDVSSRIVNTKFLHKYDNIQNLYINTQGQEIDWLGATITLSDNISIGDRLVVYFKLESSILDPMGAVFIVDVLRDIHNLSIFPYPPIGKEGLFGCWEMRSYNDNIYTDERYSLKVSFIDSKKIKVGPIFKEVEKFTSTGGTVTKTRNYLRAGLENYTGVKLISVYKLGKLIDVDLING